MTPGQPIQRSMQRRILACVLQDPALFGQVVSVLNPDYFTDDVTSDIVAFAASAWRNHREVPSKAALLDAFKEESRKDAIKRAFETDITDKKYTVQRIVDYAQDRAVRLAVSQIAEHLHAEATGNPILDKRGQPVELDAVGIMRKAVSIGASVGGLGHFLDERIDDIASRTLNPQQEEFFTTGSEHLDQAGLRISRGDVGMILGAAKVGKSQMALNIAVANSMQGVDVVYYNVEIKEERLEERFARHIAGPKADIKQDPVEFIRRFRLRFPKLLRGRILLKRYYAGVHSFDDIRTHLDQCRASGFNPGLIVVDYVGILKSTGEFKEVRHKLGDLWREFRSVCAEYRVAGWSPAQSNRGGAKEETARATDISEAYEMIAHIDAGISVNMTDEEREQGVGRIYVIASRNAPQGTTVNFSHDLSRSIIQTTGIAVTEKKADKRRGKESDEEGNERAAFRAASKDRAAKKSQEDMRP